LYYGDERTSNKPVKKCLTIFKTTERHQFFSHDWPRTILCDKNTNITICQRAFSKQEDAPSLVIALNSLREKLECII